MHQYTIYGSYRPFGVAGIFLIFIKYILLKKSVYISSYDPVDGVNLHIVETSGHVYAYHAFAHGKGRSICKSEIERRDFKSLTCREALAHVARM